jgi:hypothetical protein
MFEIPTKASVPGFGVRDGPCFQGRTFSDLARLPFLPELNAETIFGFVLRCLALKLAKIALARWKFQEQQASKILGSLMVNASKDTLSETWLVRPS